MEARTISVCLWGAAALLGFAALATGPIVALASAAGVIGLGAIALRLRQGVTPSTPGAVVAGGLFVVAMGLVIILAGPADAGILTSLAGLGLVGVGGRASLGSLQPSERELLPSLADPRLLGATAADEAMRFGYETLNRMRARPGPTSWAREMETAAERTVERGWLTDPASAHPIPPSLEKPTLVRRGVRSLGPLEHVTFPSEHEPPDAEVRDRYLGFAENRTAHAYLWRHRDGPRPTLICVHGYGMGNVAVDARVWDLSWLHRDLGLDVVLPVLPLHGPRARGWRSGPGFMEDHPLFTSAALGQAVWELRRLSGWLRQQGAPALGIYGLSLGGTVTALEASLDGGLACAVAAVPATSLSRLVFTQMSAGQREEWEAAGIDEDLLERLWAPYAPLHHRPGVEAEGRLVVAGLADRMCPPEQARALAEHWEAPIHWFPGSHTVWLGREAARARIETTLRHTLLEPPFAEHLPLTRFR